MLVTNNEEPVSFKNGKTGHFRSKSLYRLYRAEIQQGRGLRIK
jgi:hypothetical protein